MYRPTALIAAIMLITAAFAAAETATAGESSISTETHKFSTLAPIFGTETASAATNHPSGATLQSSVSTHTARLPVSDSPAAFLPLSGTSASRLSSTGDDYTTHSASMQEEKMLNFINRDRSLQGLPALTHDPELSRIARIKSADMLEGRYFSHESPTYGRVRDMLTRFGYSFRGAGENIARHATVEKVQAAFMSSEGHRRNILSSAWTKIGVGIVLDRNGYVYATQIFAR